MPLLTFKPRHLALIRAGGIEILEAAEQVLHAVFQDAADGLESVPAPAEADRAELAETVAALERLPDLQQRILRMKFGLDGCATMTDLETVVAVSTALGLVYASVRLYERRRRR